LKQQNDQPLDLETGEIGLNSAPVVAKDVVIVGAAHRAGGAPRSRANAKGYVRGFDVRTGKRLWIFHTIPEEGEFGSDTWEKDSATYTGNAGMWAPFSVDENLNLAYLPIELPTGDYYGGHRPGDGLFGESIVAVDLHTGQRKWHYQTIHHGVWDYDIPCAPILANITVNGREIRALAQPTKQGFLYVLDRETGQPVWPIPEMPVPQSKVPGETTSATQPIPSRPAPFERAGFSLDYLIDFTPELKAEALQIASRYQVGPVYTPPIPAGENGKEGLSVLNRHATSSVLKFVASIWSCGAYRELPRSPPYVRHSPPPVPDWPCGPAVMKANVAMTPKDSHADTRQPSQHAWNPSIRDTVRAQKRCSIAPENVSWRASRAAVVRSSPRVQIRV
jgi:quinoprotein glucose dehydrogenase